MSAKASIRHCSYSPFWVGLTLNNFVNDLASNPSEKPGKKITNQYDNFLTLLMEYKIDTFTIFQVKVLN